MNKLIFLGIIFILTSCSSSNHEEKCEGGIVDLEMKSFNDEDNKILKYFNSDELQVIQDTIQFIKYMGRDAIPSLFKKSTIDSTKRKFTFKVKEAIIRNSKYQWDLFAISYNDLPKSNANYWLKSYDQNGKFIESLDFASWSKEFFFCGRIDCDSTIHMIVSNDDHRIFKTNSEGKLDLIKTIKD